MTDPEGSTQEASDAAVPAAPETTATAQAPVVVAPRKRRRWAVVLLGAVVVLGLAAGGLVIWAPWIPPPVLRPTGLVAGASTANSITFHWSRPPTGPLPDKYLIFGLGAKADSVAGAVTSYQKAGLTPASSYVYRVVAVRGGKRSPWSAALTVRTVTPPISQARLQGSWQVYPKNVGHVPGGRNGYMTWQFTPLCGVGPCDESIHVSFGNFSFKMKLTRAGAAYSGQAPANLGSCGPGPNSFPDPATVKVRIDVSAAAGKGQVWAASSFAGTMAATTQYVSSGAYYCTASSIRASLSAGSA